MININAIASRIDAYGNLSRARLKTISHQTVYLRTATLSDDPLLEVNLSGMHEDYLRTLMQRNDFKELLVRLGDHYIDALPKRDQPIFSLSSVVPELNDFFTEVQGTLPAISELSLEIRPAPLFSHSVHYFVDVAENKEELEEKVRQLLTENDIPSEAVNLIVRMDNMVSYKELTHLMTVMSIILREMAFESGFIPGRVIGNFAMISE